MILLNQEKELKMSKYCDVNSVRKFLPSNLFVEGDNDNPTFGSPQSDNLSLDTIEFYIEMASGLIDAAIGTIYDVPLRETNRGGIIGYPQPIPYIASLLTARFIYEQVLQGSDNQKTEEQKEGEKRALNELKLVQNGERVLDHIRATKSSRYVTGTLYNAPFNPVNKDNKSEGV